MILEFTVGNYRSFYEPKTFSLQAQGIKEVQDSYLASHSRKKYSLTSAIYGANSSGKTNLIRAIDTMTGCVIDSVQLNDGDKLYYDPFLLHEKSEKEPTLFEIVFTHNNKQYRYGFEYTQYKIEKEWLFSGGGKKEVALFVRNDEGIGFDDNFSEGDVKIENINDNRLFLSLCAQLGGPISKSVMSWFQSDCNVVSGINNENYRAFTKTSFLERTEESHRALQLFKKLQLGFNDLTARKKEEESHIPERLSPQARERRLSRSIIIESTHNVYGESGLVCDERVFPFEERESDGTRKLFDMSGPIFDTLQRGSVLFVDELDAKMHPLISQQLIMLFNNPKHNPNKAQLIFTTHDTNLLSSHLLRRDQIWFTEKDSQEQTDLYSMMDIQFADGTKPRNDSNYEKNYIAGRYGAIPYIIND